MVLPVLLAPAAAACCGACVNDIMKQPFPMIDEEANVSEGEQEVNEDAAVPSSKEALHRSKSPLAIDMMKSFEQSKTEFRKSEYYEFGASLSGSSDGSLSSNIKRTRSSTSSNGPDYFLDPQAIVSQDGIEIAQNFSRGSSFPLIRVASSLPENDYNDTATSTTPPSRGQNINTKNAQLFSPFVSDWGYVDGKFSEGRIHNLVTKYEAQCVSFSPDTLLMAVGFESGNGFALYETRRFLLLHTVTSSDTVVSIQWRNCDPRPPHAASIASSSSLGAMNSTINRGVNETINNILAIASRDGAIDVFQLKYIQSFPTRLHISTSEISNISLTRICTVNLDGGARCMLFLPTRPTVAAELLVGTKSGSITIISNVPTCVEGSHFIKPTVNTLACYRTCVKCVAVSNHSRLLASGDENGAIRVHPLSIDLPQNSLLDRKSSRNSVLEDKEFDRIQKIHSMGDNNEPLLVREGKIRSLAFSKNDEVLLVGGYDNYVAMIDTTVWKVLREIRHDGAINAIVFNENYGYLAVGSRDKKLKIYDTSTYHAIKEIQTTGWVTSISWGSGRHAGLLAAKSGNHQVSVFNIQNTQIIKSGLPSLGKGSCVSFSPDGKFVARVSDKSIIVSSELHNFEDVAKVDRRDTAYSVKWCMQQEKYMVAAVGDDGYLAIYVLCSSAGFFYLELSTEIFLGMYLRDLSWSKQSEMIICGGREKKVHFVSITPTGFQERRKPVQLRGMIFSIDVAPESVEGIGHVGLAVGSDDGGDGVVSLFDIKKCEKVLEITRPRTVRCVRYHPTNPLLMIADSGSSVIYIDLLAEQVAKEFRCSSRVTAVDFSVCGRFVALADDTGFTLRDVPTFNILQEIEAKGRDKSLAFSPCKGLYLALDNNTHAVNILMLGPLLNSEFIPINQEFEDMPQWVLAEIYTSPYGPSMLQRFMNAGTEGSILKTVEIVKRHPEAFLTFNRKTGENCFNAAFTSGKVSLIAFAMTLLVNGSLEVKGYGRSLLMTDIPATAISLIAEMVSYMPPQFAVEIISKMNFIKVPFSHPRIVPTNSLQEMASPTFFDPWEFQNGHSKSSSNLSKQSSHHRIDLKHEHQLNPAVLPLPGLGSYKFLKALTVECPPSVFDNDAMALVLRIMWKQHIRSFFLVDFFLFVLFLSLWIIFSELSTSSSTLSDASMFSLGCIILALNLMFTVKEFVQSDMGRELDYFRSMWNLVDGLALVSVYIYVGVNLISRELTPMVEATLLWVGVFGSLCLTLKFMSYLRGFPVTSWLIALLKQNFSDVQGFAVVMFVILVGFTTSFRLVFNSQEKSCDNESVQEDCSSAFSSPLRAFFTTFQLSLLSVYDPSIIQTDYQLLVYLIFFLAVTVVTIVSLNALISILGDSYSRVQECATANQRMESAQLIVEYLSLLPRSRREKIEQRTRYFHALLKSDSHGDLLVNHDDPGLHALRALRRDISELNERSNEWTKKSIDQMRDSVDNEINMLRSDVLQALHVLSMDVKRLQRTQQAVFNPAAGAIALGNKGVMTAVSAVTNYGKMGGIFSLKNENAE